MAGGYLSYDTPSLHVGVTGIAYRHRSRDGVVLMPPKRYARRKTIGEVAVDFYGMGERWIISGELVPAARERLAFQSALSYKDDYLGALTLSGRYYGSDRITPYGHADGHYSSGRDEWGLRLQWYGEVAKYVTGTVVVDRFYRLSPGAPGGTLLLGRLMTSSYTSSSTWTLRRLAVPDRPVRLSLRYSGDSQSGRHLTLRYGARLLHTEGVGWGYGLESRVRYDDGRRLRLEGGASLHRLGDGQMVRAPLPWMPYSYSYPMLRGRGILLSAQMRLKLARRLTLYARLYGLLPHDTPATTDFSLSLTYKL